MDTAEVNLADQPKRGEEKFSPYSNKKIGKKLIFALVLIVLFLATALFYLNYQKNWTFNDKNRELKTADVKWDKTVSESVFLEYLNIAKTRNLPAEIKLANSLQTEGIYSGYKGQIIRLATSKGEMTFLLTADSTVKRITSGKTILYSYDSLVGFPMGSYLRINYKETGNNLLQATEVNVLSDSKL